MDKKPNILFFFPDQHRGDWTGLNPDLPLRTPNINQLAKKGVHFTNTFTPSPVCSPARSCMAVGKDYDKVDIIDNGQNHPFDDPTFYEILRDQAGYHTMTCGKLDLRHPEHSYGSDGQHIVNGVNFLKKWGFSEGIENGGKLNGVRTYKKERHKIGPYITYLAENDLAEVHVNDFNHRSYKKVEPTPLPDEAYGDNWIGRQAIRLIKNAPKDKPWFIQINFNGPHSPMDVTKSMREKWKDEDGFSHPIECTRFSEKEALGIQQNYAAMIENIDDWVGKCLKEVEQRGELDNTLIVYASDHGEMLGDHNLINKSVPYLGAIRVPLVIGGNPVKQKGLKIGENVSLLDLFATYLDFAGLNVKKIIDNPDELDSISLKPILDDGNVSAVLEKRNYVRSGLRHFRVLIEGKYKLVVGYHQNNNGLISKVKKKIRKSLETKKRKKDIWWEFVRLFDLKNDPRELTDISRENLGIVNSMLDKIVYKKK